MIRHILKPLIPWKFLSDARYREGHLRVLNALPGREVLGLHSPDMKDVAKRLALGGCAAADGACGQDLIAAFESADPASLCYEEMAVWGFMINFVKCPVERKFEMLDKYVPVLDNWGVCDSFVSHAKWMKKVPADVLLAYVDRWFRSSREFEVRFAVIVSMCYLMDNELDEVLHCLGGIDYENVISEYISVKKRPEGIRSGCVLGPTPYYVYMGVAWLLATALAKHPAETRAYVRTCNLPPDVLKLYARKARESFRTRDVSPF